MFYICFSLSPLTSDLDFWFLLSLFSCQTKASLNSSTNIICFSLSSHFRSWLLISSLSLLTSDQSFPQQLNRERTKWHSNQIQEEANHLHGRGHSIGSSPLRSAHRHRHRRRRCKRHGRGHSDHHHSDQIIAIVIVVGGASGMGEATPIIHIVIAVVIAIVIAAPISPISLSFLVVVVLIVDGWVDGGRLIKLWVWDLGWFWCLSLGWLGWLIRFWL